MSNARNLANLLGTSTTITQDKISSEVSLGGVTTYDNISTLPLSGNDIGDQAFVDSDNRLYIWNGSGWYNIALINTSPSITGGNESSYLFETDGTPIEITLVGSDPEGIPLTWSYEVTSGSLTNGGGTTATVSNVDNVFTITPTTTEDYAGSFSLTFKASDGVNLGTAVSSFTLQFKIVNSNYTTLLAKGTAATRNATFVDSSTNAHTITANGDVYQGAFSPYRHGGYSMYFDGTGDVLYAAENTEFNVGVGDFTFESWIHPTSFTTNDWNTVFSVGNTTNFGGLLVGKSNTNTFCIRQYGTATIVETATLPPLNSWTHIACVRSSGTSTLYYNGVAIASATDSTNYTTATPFAHVGNSDHTTYSHYFNGYISNPRLVVGTAVYTSDFTPPTEPLTAITNTSLLINTPYIADSSTNAHAITVNGNTSTQPFSPFDHEVYDAAINGGSAYFGGTDYVSYTEPTIAVGQDFCFEFWINFTSAVAISNGEIRAFGSSPNDPLLYFSTDGTTISSVEFYMNNSSVFSLSNTFSLNTWYHIAVSRSSGEVSLFINGKLKGTNTNTNSIGGGTYFVGSHPTANWGITGYMSDYRSVIGSPVYTTDFTPPTAPLTEITNTSALLKFTNAGIQDYSQVTDLKTVGNATGSNTQTKNASYSMYFDGNGDYIIPNNVFDGFTSTSMSWTIEFWIYPVTASWAGVEIPIGINAISDGSNCFLWRGDSIYITATGYNFSAAPTAGSWQHIAITYNGTTVTCYLDGTSVYSGTHTIPTAFANCVLGIGAEFDAANAGTPGNYFNGYIEDLRITKGLARYTANFTPPTTELLG